LKKIIVSKNGLYLVSGNIPLAVQVITPNEEGLSWDWKQGETSKTPYIQRNSSWVCMGFLFFALKTAIAEFYEHHYRSDTEQDMICL